MHPGLVGKAAKLGRNNTNGVPHLTRKTLFEPQSWKKMGAIRKNLAKNWQRRTCSYDKNIKIEKKWGGGRTNVLTNLSSMQPVCRQKLGYHHYRYCERINGQSNAMGTTKGLLLL